MKKIIFLLSCILNATLGYSAMIQITNSSSSPDAFTCQQSANYTVALVSDVDVSNITRSISIPVGGANFKWDANSLPLGVSLTTNLSGNLLNISIASLLSNTPISIVYSIEAGCSATISNGILVDIPVTNDASGNSFSLANNTPLNIKTGLNGSLLSLGDPVFFNLTKNTALPSSTANFGETVSRTYTLRNNSPNPFSGVVFFSNNSQTGLQFNKLTYTYTDNTSSLKTGTLNGTNSSSFDSFFQVLNLPNQGQILITEELTVVSCLEGANGGRGGSAVLIEYGCNQFDKLCSKIYDNQLNIVRSSDRPILTQINYDNPVTIPYNQPFPICFDNLPYHRTLTYRNEGLSVAKNIVISLAFDNYGGGLIDLSSTVIPVNSVSLTIHKLSGTTVYAGKTGLNQILVNNLSSPIDNYVSTYPNTSLHTSKCAGDVLRYGIGLAITETLLPGEWIDVVWDEMNCCPFQPSLAYPNEWIGGSVHTFSAYVPSYMDECDVVQTTVNNGYPSPVLTTTNSAKRLDFLQNLLPYTPRLSGVTSAFLGTPQYPFSGQVTNIEVETFEVINNAAYNGLYNNSNLTNSFLDVDIELEDGLTLLSVDGSLNPTGGNYPVVFTNSKFPGISWTGSVINSPALVSALDDDQSTTSIEMNNIDNQINSGDDKNEKWTVRFALSSLSSAVPPIDFIDFITNSILSYRLRAVCASNQGTSKFYTSFYFVPGDNTGPCMTISNGISINCRVPINTINKPIIVTCPGCINPGVVMGPVNIRRDDSSIGAIDNNNNGIDDAFEPAFPVVDCDPTTPAIDIDCAKRNYATLGDLLNVTESIVFKEGDPGSGGFLNSDLHLKAPAGIYIDNIYIVSDALTGLDVVSGKSTVRWGSNVFTLPTSNVRKIGGKQVFKVSASDIASVNSSSSNIEYINNQYVFKTGALFVIENQYKITENITTDIETVEISYQGILTDIDLDLTTLTVFPSFVGGTCNDLPLGTTCTSVFNILSPNMYEYFCEPSNSNNFLFIPIIKNDGAGVYEGKDRAFYTKEICTQSVRYLAMYYHPKLNAFPFEARNYGTGINFNLNVPVNDYEITRIDITNNSYYGIENNLRNTQHINLVQGGSGTNGIPGLTPDPNGKGSLLILQTNMVALPLPVSNDLEPILDGGTNLNFGDERLDLTVSVILNPIKCGIISNDYVYTADLFNFQIPLPIGSSYYNYTNLYPWPTIEYTTNFKFGASLASYSIAGSFIKPYTELSNQGNSGSDRIFTFGKANTNLNLTIKNNNFLNRYMLNENGHLGGYINSDPSYFKDSKNTFMAFSGLPSGFIIKEITFLENGSSRTVSPNGNGIFELGNIPGGGNTVQYSIVGGYDCSVPYTNFPFNILYGWNCDGYPTSITQITQTNGVCFYKSEQYFLTTEALNLGLSPSVTPALPEVCQDFDYRVRITSTEVGEFSNFGMKVTLPSGITYDVSKIAQVSYNGGAFVDVSSSAVLTGSTYTWLDIFSQQPLNAGEFIEFKMSLTSTCDFQTGQQIVSEVNALNYCGQNLINNVMLSPTFTVSNSAYDQLQVSLLCTPNYVNPSTATLVVINTGSTIANNGNVLSLALPAGSTLIAAGTTADYSVNGQTISWNLPSINSGASSIAYIVKYQLTAPVCETNYILNANVTGKPELSCGTTGVCATEKNIATQACTTSTGPCCKYILEDVEVRCGQNEKKCIAIKAVRAVNDGIIGMDFTLKYDYRLMRPTGVASVGGVVVNNGMTTDMASYALTYDKPVSGQPDFRYLHGSIFYTGSSTATADFDGIGEVICIEFKFVGSYTAGKVGSTFHLYGGDMVGNTFGQGLIDEEYKLKTVRACMDDNGDGIVKVIKDNFLNGKIIFHDQDIPNSWLKYDPLDPAKFLITQIRPASVTAVPYACSPSTSLVTTTDLNGNFSLDMTGLNGLKISRDIVGDYQTDPTCTYPGSVIDGSNNPTLATINGYDSYLMESITTFRNSNQVQFVYDRKVPGVVSPIVANVKFPTPYQMIAADVNMTNSVRANDITLVQQRAVARICEYPQVWNYTLGSEPNLYPANSADSRSLDWRFTDKTSGGDFSKTAGYPNAAAVGYWRDDVPDVNTCITAPAASGNACKAYATTKTIHAILLGDLDGSWRANATFQKDLKVATTSEVILDYKNIQQINTSTYRVPVKFNANDTTVSVDFALDYDETKLKVMNVGKLSAAENVEARVMFNDHNNQELLFTSYTMADFGYSNTLYYIDFVSMYGDMKPAYLGQGEGYLNGQRVALTLEGATPTGTLDQLGVNGYGFEIIPNPNNGIGNILYNLKGEDNARIVVYNAVGQIVLEYNAISGTGSLELSSAGLASGMYQVILFKGESDRLAKKMVIQK